VNSNYAVFLGSGLGRAAWARYKDTPTRGDYQRIGVVAGTPANWGLPSYLYIAGRADAPTATGQSTSGCYAKLSNNTADICYVDAGGEKIIGSVPKFRFKNGATYWFECGVGGSPRTFRLLENTTVLLTATDMSSASPMGPNNRHFGFATYQPNDLTRPGVVAAFAAYDNLPQPMLGSGYAAYRAPGAGITDAKLSTGLQPFPNGWFSTLDYKTDDMTFNPTGNVLTVGQTGWYAVDVSQYATGNVGVGAGGTVRAAVRVNGTLKRTGQPVV
jgi:hypothetical protein